MKAFLCTVIVILAGTVAGLLGHSSVATGVTAVAAQGVAGTSEPAAMVLSGVALIGLAGALKRWSKAPCEIGRRQRSMKQVCMALALVAAIPLAARAEPISVNLESSTNAGYTSTATTEWFTVDMGELALSGANSTATFFFDGLKHGSDYTVVLNVSNASGLENLRFELLDPLDSDDAFDAGPRPTGLPSGYSLSNNIDGFSFAQDSGFARSATFAGGSIFAVADERTHRGDILMFSGLNGAEDARVTFGLRDRIGQRGFLIRVTAVGGGLDATPNPEPASMLLLGTGLAGIAGAYRRRKQARRT